MILICRENSVFVQHLFDLIPTNVNYTFLVTNSEMVDYSKQSKIFFSHIHSSNHSSLRIHSSINPNHKYTVKEQTVAYSKKFFNREKIIRGYMCIFFFLQRMNHWCVFFSWSLSLYVRRECLPIKKQNKRLFVHDHHERIRSFVFVHKGMLALLEIKSKVKFRENFEERIMFGGF